MTFLHSVMFLFRIVFLTLTGHGAELPYVFHTLEDEYSRQQREVADEVSRYWGNFVKYGDPSHGDTTTTHVSNTRQLLYVFGIITVLGLDLCNG